MAIFKQPYCLLFFVTFLLFGRESLACPLVNGLVDFNCDQKLRVTVTGDGIVSGAGDVVDGGYVGRLTEALPGVEFSNLGVNKISSRGLLGSFSRLLRQPKTGETLKKSRNVDIFIIQVGNNDFNRHQKPATTLRNIKKLVELLRSELAKDGAVTPFIVVTTLPPTKVKAQQKYVGKVNRMLLAESSDSLPVYVRFDNLPVREISFDRIHPTPEGYTELASILRTFLTGDAQTLLSSLRSDQDQDGLYDLFEEDKFHTSVSLADSDLDGLKDGEEIFTYRTDPANVDTDGDGIQDGEEIATGRDPLVAGA